MITNQSTRSMMQLRAKISRADRLEVLNGIPVGNVDGYGHGKPSAANPTGWSVIYDSQPCWVYRQDGRRVISNERTVSNEYSTLGVPLGTDLQEGDRVDQVTDRLGNVLFGPLQVTHVTHKLRYIDARLLEVDRGSN